MSEQGSEYLYVLLRRAARELERLEAVGLSRGRARLKPNHVPVLAALLEASPLTPGELAVRCDIEPSTLTGILKTLEDEGLVQREKVAADQRTQAVTLTPRGRAAGRVAIRTRLAAQQAIQRALPRGGASELTSLLGQVATAAQEAAELAAQRKTLPRVRRR